MAERKLNVLFVCVGNSARSIMAEALLDRFGSARFTAFSAGTQPHGEVHPLTIELLQHHGFSPERFRCKSWMEFTGPSAPRMDFVISVCERPGSEAAWSAWPADAVKAHWRITDPASVGGSAIERMNAFRRTFRELENRIKLFSLVRHEASEQPSRAA